MVELVQSWVQAPAEGMSDFRLSTAELVWSSVQAPTASKSDRGPSTMELVRSVRGHSWGGFLLDTWHYWKGVCIRAQAHARPRLSAWQHCSPTGSHPSVRWSVLWRLSDTVDDPVILSRTWHQASCGNIPFHPYGGTFLNQYHKKWCYHKNDHCSPHFTYRQRRGRLRQGWDYGELW